jgi:hypothetical protein
MNSRICGIAEGVVSRSLMVAVRGERATKPRGGSKESEREAVVHAGLAASSDAIVVTPDSAMFNSSRYCPMPERDARTQQ